MRTTPDGHSLRASGDTTTAGRLPARDRPARRSRPATPPLAAESPPGVPYRTLLGTPLLLEFGPFPGVVPWLLVPAVQGVEEGLPLQRGDSLVEIPVIGRPVASARDARRPRVSSLTRIVVLTAKSRLLLGPRCLHRAAGAAMASLRERMGSGPVTHRGRRVAYTCPISPPECTSHSYHFLHRAGPFVPARVHCESVVLNHSPRRSTWLCPASSLPWAPWP